MFYSGLSKTVVPIDGKGQVAVPANISGQVYAVATLNKTIVAGPAILLF